MIRRHAIGGFVGAALVLLLGIGTDRSYAADVKAAPPAALKVVAGPAASKAAVAGSAIPAALAAGPAAPAAPPPEVAPAAPPTYSYNPAGKSDPFKPFLEIDLAVKREKEKKAKEEEIKRAVAAKRPISPLQQAEIRQFRLVGIAGDNKTRMAIVEDTVAKRIYPLFVGTYIGPNGGRVASILPDRLIVEEPLPGQVDRGRKAQIRRITVTLHKEEEGKP